MAIVQSSGYVLTFSKIVRLCDETLPNDSHMFAGIARPLHPPPLPCAHSLSIRRPLRPLPLHCAHALSHCTHRLSLVLAPSFLDGMAITCHLFPVLVKRGWGSNFRNHSANPRGVSSSGLRRAQRGGGEGREIFVRFLFTTPATVQKGACVYACQPPVVRVPVPSQKGAFKRPWRGIALGGPCTGNTGVVYQYIYKNAHHHHQIKLIFGFLVLWIAWRVAAVIVEDAVL